MELVTTAITLRESGRRLMEMREFSIAFRRLLASAFEACNRAAWRCSMTEEARTGTKREISRREAAITSALGCCAIQAKRTTSTLDHNTTRDLLRIRRSGFLKISEAMIFTQPDMLSPREHRGMKQSRYSSIMLVTTFTKEA